MSKIDASNTRALDSTSIRHGFVYSFMALYILYALFRIGLAGLLYSLSIGLILYSFDISIELITSIVILSGLAWKLFIVGFNSKEGFDQAHTGTGQSLKAIVKKVKEIQQPNVFQPSGVLSSTLSEGFANPDSETTLPIPDTKAPAPQKKDETTEKAASTVSGPASTTAPTVSTTMAAAIPSPEKETANKVSGFTDKIMDGMFKLGSIPPDAVGGSHIDVGTTLMNALNSLKPDQVKQMTDDSRKLMETQKNLMGMLGTMKPMLEDGKQLMETFQEMFGGMK